MTLIEGASGWIVIDPLTSQETAAFAMDFVAQHLGARPVSTMIFSHSPCRSLWRRPRRNQRRRRQGSSGAGDRPGWVYGRKPPAKT
nr:MBL fold metallo-hydrolase [Pseudomonas aeruginosa]